MFPLYAGFESRAIEVDNLRARFYRPQTKFAKVMFLHLSVSHSVHGGMSASLHAGIHPPVSRQSPESRHPPPAQCMLGDTGNKRAVSILLERILVIVNFFVF